MSLREMDRPMRAAGGFSGWTPARWIATALVVAFFVFPVLFMVMVSLKTQSDIATGGFFPEQLFWQNYPDAFGSVAVDLYLRNSALAAIIGATVTLMVAAPATHAMIRFRVGGKFLPAFVLGTYVAPPIVALFPLFFLLKTIGLNNSIIGLGLVYGVMNLPVAFWLLSSFVRRLPLELEEAAYIDGASYFGVLRRVALPLMLPGIVSTGIICLILSYNEFLLGAFLNKPDAAKTLPTGLALYQGDRQLRYGQMAVASLAGIAPVYVLATFFQRWLIRGLTSGGVK
ncbi:MAG: carbohydrate ABC transporter permease [Alphaproteobacteria bacterium]